MTFRPRVAWQPLDVLMGMSIGDRVKYVRTNLATDRPRARREYLTHDEFAQAVGAPERQSVIRWEKGSTPKRYAERIAMLTPYPPAAFGAPGEAELVRESLGNRLREVEELVATLRSEHASFVEGVLGRLAALEAAPARAKPRSTQQSTGQKGRR